MCSPCCSCLTINYILIVVAVASGKKGWEWIGAFFCLEYNRNLQRFVQLDVLVHCWYYKWAWKEHFRVALLYIFLKKKLSCCSSFTCMQHGDKTLKWLSRTHQTQHNRKFMITSITKLSCCFGLESIYTLSSIFELQGLGGS